MLQLEGVVSYGTEVDVRVSASSSISF